MTPETVAKLKQCEKLMIEKREIEEDLDALKEEIVPELSRDAKVETENGVFTLQSRDKWVYSVETRDMEKKLKAIQEREKQDGTAESVPGEPYLVYNVAK